MFEGSVRGCFESFKESLRKFIRGVKLFNYFSRHFQGIFNIDYGNFKVTSILFQGCFKNVSRVNLECFKDVNRLFYRSCQGISRSLQRS